MNESIFRESLGHLTTKILVSCNKDAHGPGGLFIVDFNLKNIRKVLTADCRGVADIDNGFLVATNSHGILKLDKELNVVNKFDVPNWDLHGMKFDKQSSLLYLVETKHNAIGIYEINPFKRVDEIKISPFDDDQNHVNDIWLEGNSLYVSMFSLEGGFRERDGVQDGVIAEYDLTEKTIKRVLFNGLQYPHTVFKVDDDIFYCDSLRLNFKKGNSIVAQFNGFTRGCAFDGRYFYIGQSEMRHLSKILETQPNVSIDCGIHIFDSTSRTDRFIPFPTNQIYEIMLLDHNNKQLPTALELNSFDSDKCLLIDSWHDAESNHRWMNSKKSYVYLGKPKSNAKKILIDASNGFPGAYSVNVYLNGVNLGHYTFAKDETRLLEFSIGQHNFLQKNEIVLEVEKLWEPAECFNSEDQRSLGLAVRKITLE